MHPKPRPIFSVAAAAALWGIFTANPVIAADRAHPVVVELFQSQGCSSCPPANANVMALSGRPELLTLSFGVTYWDYLGWKDTFASPQFTQRQWDYAHALHHSNVFTPQIVINGRTDLVGTNRAELEAAIAAQKPVSGAPQIAITNGQAMVSAGKGTGQIWLVRFDPNIVQVPITRGENGGSTLPHRNVVKALVKLGDWSGKAQSYRLPKAAQPGWRSAILIQKGAGGPILAAARD